MIDMNFLEKDLEQIIYEAPKEQLRERGLPIVGTTLRQVRIGNYGVADLITIQKPDFIPYESGFHFHDSHCLVTIYELKQDKIGISTFLQAIRYAKGISSWYYQSKFCLTDIHLKFKIVLIGKSIDVNSDFVYLTDLLEDRDGNNLLEYYTYEYKFDGMYFTKRDGFKLIQEGF
jgi:hypothetical protein